MRRRLLVALAAVTLLVACDPGEPDIDYGRYGVVPAPAAAVLGPDGSVLGLVPKLFGDTPIRLDPEGKADPRWTGQLPMYVTSLVPGLDGGVIVIGRDSPDPGDDARIQRLSADGRPVGPLTVVEGVRILDARDLPGRLRLVVVKVVDVSGGDFHGLAMIDVVGDAGTQTVALPASFADAHQVLSASAVISADGSFVVADHAPGAGPSSYTDRLRRFDPDGDPDVGFGDGGTLLTTSLATCANGEAAYVDLAPGSGSGTVWATLSCALQESSLFRLTATGAVDTSWSGGSLSLSEVVSSPEVVYVQWFPQEDGSVYVALSTCLPQPRFDCVGKPWQLARYDSSGAIDTEWGTEGLARPLVDTPFSIRATSQGVMMLGFQRAPSGGNQVMVHRLVGPVASGQVGS